MTKCSHARKPATKSLAMHEAERESLSHLFDNRYSLNFRHIFLSVHHSIVTSDGMFVPCKKHCHMYAPSQCQHWGLCTSLPCSY